MKKFIVLGFIMLIIWSGLLNAEEAYVNHIIVNNYNDHGLDYELSGSNTSLYKGFLNPGQVKRVNMSDPLPQQLYGSYFLRYTTCRNQWLLWTCKSYSQMLLVKQSEEVIWEITPTGVKFTESVLQPANT